MGWRCFMRSASVSSLNGARGLSWSISTSLGWRDLRSICRTCSTVVPLRIITSSRRSLHPCLSWCPLQRLLYRRIFSLNFFFFGVWIVPGFLLGVSWLCTGLQYQCYCFGTRLLSTFPLVLLHHFCAYLVLSAKPMCLFPHRVRYSAFQYYLRDYLYFCSIDTIPV